MTIAALLKKTLEGLGYPATNAVYTEAADTYFVFNESVFGADFADDAPQLERHLVQVHLFAPLKINVSALCRETKQALFDAGFSWPEIIDVSDKESRHKVFECEIVAAVGE